MALTAAHTKRSVRDCSAWRRSNNCPPCARHLEPLLVGRSLYYRSRKAQPVCSATSSTETIAEPQTTATPDARLSGFSVFVAGATGGTGREVTNLLVKSGVPVRALVRDVAKAEQVLKADGPGTLELVKGDVYQFSSLQPAIGSCNAIICCTGAADPSNPFGPFNVDFQGTVNLVALARRQGIKKFILVSSIGADDPFNPLNLFWGVLFWKKRAEEELQRSGLDYTIVRPGGLSNQSRPGEAPAPIVMAGPDYFGFPGGSRVPAGSILRSQVAEVCVAALVEAGASNKVVEVVTRRDEVRKSLGELFESVSA